MNLLLMLFMLLNPCPDWFPMTCLDARQEHIMVDGIDYGDGRWTITQTLPFPVPTPPLVFGTFNFNRWRLQIVWVGIDLGGIKAIDYGAILVCDTNGSTQPTLSFSIPAQPQIFPIQNMGFHILNYNEAINTRCGY